MLSQELKEKIIHPMFTRYNRGLINNKTMEENEINLLSTRRTKDTFTVNGCGKFGESKIHLNKTEAYALFVELYNWIEEHTEQNKQQDNEKIYI